MIPEIKSRIPREAYVLQDPRGQNPGFHRIYSPKIIEYL